MIARLSQENVFARLMRCFRLLEYAPSRLTGTGACVFAEFDTESEARQVLEQAPEWLNGFVAKGVNLSPLHRAML